MVVIFNPISVFFLGIFGIPGSWWYTPSLTATNGQALARDSEQDLRQVVQEGPDGIPKFAKLVLPRCFSAVCQQVNHRKTHPDAVSFCQLLLSASQDIFEVGRPKPGEIVTVPCSVSLSQRHDWNTCHKSHMDFGGLQSFNLQHIHIYILNTSYHIIVLNQFEPYEEL